MATGILVRQGGIGKLSSLITRVIENGSALIPAAVTCDLWTEQRAGAAAR